jgi:hypothetical protein
MDHPPDTEADNDEGGQIATPLDVPLPTNGTALTFSQTASMFASNKPKLLGTDAAARFLTTYLAEQDHRMMSALDEARSARVDEKKALAVAANAELQLAVAQTKMEGEDVFRTLRTFAGVAGGILVAVGADLCKMGSTMISGILVFGLGIVFLIGTIVRLHKKDNK